MAVAQGSIPWTVVVLMVLTIFTLRWLSLRGMYKLNQGASSEEKRNRSKERKVAMKNKKNNRSAARLWTIASIDTLATIGTITLTKVVPPTAS